MYFEIFLLYQVGNWTRKSVFSKRWKREVIIVGIVIVVDLKMEVSDRDK